MNRKEFKKQLDARFDAFEEKFNKLDENFDKLNARLDESFNKLESGLDDIGKMIKEQTKTYEQINDSLSIIQRDCQNNEDSY